MKAMKKKTIAVWLLAMLCSAVHGAEHPWPMFARDAQHTARSEDTIIGCQLNWSYKTSNQYIYSGIAVSSDGGCWYGSNDWRVYHLLSDGTLSWSYETGDVFRSSPALNDNDSIYAGSRDGKLYRIASDGSLMWSIGIGGVEFSSPTVFDDKVYIGVLDFMAYCIESNGTIGWSYNTGGSIRTSPAVEQGTGRVFIGSDSNYLFSLASSGSLSWSYCIAGDPAFSSASLGEGEVYIGTSDNTFYSMDKSGAFRWSYRAGDRVFATAAIGSDGKVYFSAKDTNLYALNSGGSLMWSHKIASNYSYGSPNIFSNAIVAGGDHGIMAINPDGTFWWSYGGSGMDVTYSGVSSGPGGIYLGTNDGRIRSLGSIATPTPTITPTATVTPTITPTATPTYCHEPMIITSGGGDANIPAPAATATDGWLITFLGASDDAVFASIYDSENVTTPGEGTGPQPLKITIQRVGEAINIPAGYPLEYMDGDTLKKVYLPELAP